MTRQEAPRAAVILLVIAAALGALTAFFATAFLTEYGTTTGSWTEGAIDALRFALAPLIFAVGLAAAAFAYSRGSGRVRGLAVATVALSVAAVLGGGAQAAVAKYDTLPVAPECEARGFAPPIRSLLHRIEDAFGELDHPDRFSGGGGTGVDGCQTNLLNVSYDEAAEHYRAELPSAGWEITQDTPTRLRAERDDLHLVLHNTPYDEVSIAIRPTRATVRQVLEGLP